MAEELSRVQSVVPQRHGGIRNQLHRLTVQSIWGVLEQRFTAAEPECKIVKP